MWKIKSVLVSSCQSALHRHGAGGGDSWRGPGHPNNSEQRENVMWISRNIGFATLGAVVVACTGAALTGSSDKLIVHEWGTFLTVQGSDGVTQGGMVDSEENLPGFVCERPLNGRSRANLFLKMETPVTYFYADKPRKVHVQVGMTNGLLTHWFPTVVGFGPAVNAKDPGADSNLDWGEVELIPDRLSQGQRSTGSLPDSPAASLREVENDNTWQFARETDAAFVKVAKRHELEKFLFYRGVGSFDLPLQVVATDDSSTSAQLTICNRGKERLQGIFAIHVDQHTIRCGALPDLLARASQSSKPDVDTRPAVDLTQGVEAAKQQVAASLVAAGLYPKEARAMVNTWEQSYFRTEGLRLLYILPRATVDEVIPIQVQPAPDQLVRVMIGRVEVLTPSAERQIERAVADLDAKDPLVRKTAQAELDQLGRLREPVLRRLMSLTVVPEIRSRAEGLIKKAAYRPQHTRD